MNFISIEDVIDINEILEKESKGVIKPNELESAIVSIRQSMYGTYLYDSIYRMASHLTCSHCFSDGNKRTSVLSGIRFLEMNGIHFKENKQIELSKKILDVTTHKMSEDEYTQYLIDNCY